MVLVARRIWAFPGGAGLPTFVTDEFDAFLACGILAHGLLRLSCGARRMHEAAAHLFDNFIPKVPVRQWVLSFPIPLRGLHAVHPELLAPILQIIHRAIATFLIERIGIKRDQAATGALTLIQRFGSAANLNIHLHALVLDAVYGNLDAVDTSGIPDESMPAPAALVPICHPAGAPTHAALQALMARIITRILRPLTRLSYFVEEAGEIYLAGSATDPDDVMTPLQAAANYRIAQGPRAGQKLLSPQLAPRHLARGGESSALCANAHGPSTRSGQASACMQACALGAIVETRVRYRHRALPSLRRATEADRGDRRTGRHRRHPYASGAGRPAAAACTG